MSSSLCQCVLFFVCALAGLSAASSLVSSDVSEPAFSLSHRLHPFQMPGSLKQQMNKMLAIIMDMTFEMYREMGATPQALKELHHKRSLIQTCYFQAVSCY